MAKKVVVIGGGFAGLESAIQLRKRGFEVTLVSDRDYLFIYPISIWVPVGELAWEDACEPLGPLADTHGFALVISELQGFDFAANVVKLTDLTLPYDYLVLAFGGGKTKPAGIEHTLSPCGPPSASLAIKDELDALIAKAVAAREAGSDERFRIACGFGGNPKDPSAVRGGPMFEVVYNIHNLLSRRGLLDRVQIDFFAPMPEPGKKMHPQAPARLEKSFEGLGIGWHVGTKIERFEPDGVVFAGGEKLAADLTLFIPAGKGHPLVEGSGLPTSEAGFVRVDATCQVVGLDNVYAAGDVAALEGPDWVAKQGHVAEAMGRVIAHNLAMRAAGTPDEQQSYQHHLSLMCVMDTGTGATFVYRDDKRAIMVPAPIVGHWAKQAWGSYWKKSKRGSVPRIPGM